MRSINPPVTVGARRIAPSGAESRRLKNKQGESVWKGSKAQAPESPKEKEEEGVGGHAKRTR